VPPVATPPDAQEALLTLLAGAPALAVSLVGWWLNRRDLKEQVKALREDNARLLDALNLAATGKVRP
jgi:hypothetical protein